MKNNYNINDKIASFDQLPEDINWKPAKSFNIIKRQLRIRKAKRILSMAAIFTGIFILSNLGLVKYKETRLKEHALMLSRYEKLRSYERNMSSDRRYKPLNFCLDCDIDYKKPKTMNFEN